MTYALTAAHQKMAAFLDPQTARTVHQLTNDGLNISPYFNSYAWTADSHWVFFIRIEGKEAFVDACEVNTGCKRRLAGPFRAPGAINHEADIQWPTLNAIPGTRAVTFIAEGFVWRADIEGAEPVRLAKLPHPFAYYGDTDVTSDGKWHVISAVIMSEAGWRNIADLVWPLDPFFQKHLHRSTIFRVALDGGERIEHLFDVPGGWVSHVSVNPVDTDLIMYCHEGGEAYQWGRVFLRHIREPASRPLRDQRSGKVWVTHERWCGDGKRFVYHGHYAPTTPDAAISSYAGVFDIDRDLPVEYIIEGPRRAFSHVSPSPDGTRLLLEYLPNEKAEPQKLFELIVDRARGTCRREPVCSVTSDLSPLPNDQWRSIDPIFSPDGRRVLFKAARDCELHLYVVDFAE